MVDWIPEEFRDKVIAVDFDGTLFEKKRFPGFGAPKLGLIGTLRYLQRKRGCKLILWTCREGRELEMALEGCGGVGLRFDAVNEGLPGESRTRQGIWRSRLGRGRNISYQTGCSVIQPMSVR